MTPDKVAATVIEIVDELSADEITKLRRMAKAMNDRGVPGPYGQWNATRIVRAIAEYTSGRLRANRA